MSRRRGSSWRPRGLGALAASLARSATLAVRRASIASRRPASGGIEDPRVVRVAYGPRRDGQPDPGEVVWAWIPFEDDPSQGKDRPAIVIGSAGAALALVPFTSRVQHGRDDAYEIGAGGWDCSGRSSWVKLDRLVGVDAASVRREGATLDLGRFTELIRRLRALHGEQLRLTG